MTSTAELPRPSKSGKDTVLEAAVDLAREIAIEEGGEFVGEHLGFVLEDTRLGSHYFACLNPGYRGWFYAVTLTRIPRSRTATVCESGLVPGASALLAKAWVPWADRLSPQDVRPTDRLPYRSDDPRLEAGYEPTGDVATDHLAIVELGLGRSRVPTRKALDEAAERWYAGEQGPKSAGARAADGDCSTCGFLVPLSGHLGKAFGVCVNEWSPDDGKVVALNHGCGSHSETDVADGHKEWVQTEPVLDGTELEVVDL